MAEKLSAGSAFILLAALAMLHYGSKAPSFLIQAVLLGSAALMLVVTGGIILLKRRLGLI